MEFRLLDRFRGLFEGKVYLHRSSKLGDLVAQELYEDLYTLNRSAKLRARIEAGSRVINPLNGSVGIKARRGDGTFGELVPRAVARRDEGWTVARGPIATVEIGAEVKIFAKAMGKQIGRVMTVLADQATHFRKGGASAISVAVVGINSAERYTSFEGEKRWTTDGSGGYRHPGQEAERTEQLLRQDVQAKFDHFLVLRFKATNEPPFPFSWVDAKQAELEYGAILTRISLDYEARF